MLDVGGVALLERWMILPGHVEIFHMGWSIYVTAQSS